MFDLDKAVAEWRRRMTEIGIPAEAVDELEEHLREDVARQIAQGLESEDACQVAVLGLGDVAEIKAEFSLADPETIRRRRRFSLVVRAVTAAYLLVFTAFFATSARFHLAERASGIAAVVLGVAVVAAWSWICRRLPVIPQRRTRMIIGLAAAISVNVAAIAVFNFGLPALAHSEGWVMVTALWTMTLLAVAGATRAGLDEAVRLRGMCTN